MEKWYAKVVNKLLPNCINLPMQMHRWRLLELALAQEIEVQKATDFYHRSAFTRPDSKVRISSWFTSGNNRLSGQKIRIIAVSSEPVSTQFLQPITTRIGDYSYLYIQYGISITLNYTKQVPDSSFFFWLDSFLSSFHIKASWFPNWWHLYLTEKSWLTTKS